ncbi:MAG TPA: T9SS type A sorting domain-containing protein, partial [Flavobacteriales bacterium]|nr:T9SS type A sorting domain-containing protein [Flavobacteriales bacterium]
FDNTVSPAYLAYAGRIGNAVSYGKFNLSTGSVSWANTTAISGYNYAQGMDVKFQGGNIFVCGLANHPVTLDDAFVLKVNGSGSVMYLQTFNGSANDNDRAKKVVINPSGEAYIYGTSTDPTQEFFVARYTTSGSLVWKSQYIPPSGEVVEEAVDMVFNNTYTQLYTIGQTSNAGLGNGGLALFDPVMGTLNHSAILSYPTMPSAESFKKITVDNANNYYLSAIANSSSFLVAKRNSANLPVYHFYYNQPVTAYAGTFVDVTGNIFLTGSINQSTTTYNDVVIVKYSAAGSMLWDGVFDSEVNSSDYTTALFTDNIGNPLLIGNVTNSLTDLDAVVKKYDPAGNVLWTNVIDYGTTYNSLNGYAQTSINEIFISTNNPSGYSDVTKIDGSGNTMWNTTVNYVAGTGFSVDPTSNFFYMGEASVTGQSNFKLGKYNSTTTPVWTSLPIVNPAVTAILSKTVNDASDNLYALGMHIDNSKYWLYIEKYNSAGIWQWGKKIMGHDSTQFVLATDLQLDASGNPLLLGYVKMTGGADAEVISKLDASTGNVFFKTFYNAGNTHNQFGYAMAQDAMGQIYIAGSHALVTTPAYKVASVQKFSAAGIFQWEYTHPSIIGSDYFSKVALDVTGHIVLTGARAFYPNPFTFGSHILTVKLNSTGSFAWAKTFESDLPGSFNVGDMKLFNNRIYISASGQMSAGNNHDLALVKYCDNAAPVVLDPVSSSPISEPVLLCSGSTINLTSDAFSPLYQWFPNGETTPIISASTSGLYSVKTTELDGCAKVSDTVQVLVKSIPVTPSVCAVTVDSASTHNIIVWDKSAYTDVTHFIIYREDVTNIYMPIGSVPYDSLSEYHDFGANPNITTKRYKISAVDSCGTESDLSPYHNTLYVSNNGFGEFSWNLYEIESGANPVTSYELYRADTIGAAWVMVGSTAGTQQILIDPDYDLFTNASWYVSTVWGISCTPTRAGISTSRSNIRTHNALIIGSAADEIAEEGGLLVYPNPSANKITITTKMFVEGKTTLFFKDASGRLVFERKVESPEQVVDISALATGVYFVECKIDKNTCLSKFVKL